MEEGIGPEVVTIGSSYWVLRRVYLTIMFILSCEYHSELGTGFDSGHKPTDERSK